MPIYRQNNIRIESIICADCLSYTFKRTKTPIDFPVAMMIILNRIIFDCSVGEYNACIATSSADGESRNDEYFALPDNVSFHAIRLTAVVRGSSAQHFRRMTDLRNLTHPATNGHNAFYDTKNPGNAVFPGFLITFPVS